MYFLLLRTVWPFLLFYHLLLVKYDEVVLLVLMIERVVWLLHSRTWHHSTSFEVVDNGDLETGSAPATLCQYHFSTACPDLRNKRKKHSRVALFFHSYNISALRSLLSVKFFPLLLPYLSSDLICLLRFSEIIRFHKFTFTYPLQITLLSSSPCGLLPIISLNHP